MFFSLITRPTVFYLLLFVTSFPLILVHGTLNNDVDVLRGNIFKVYGLEVIILKSQYYLNTVN